MNEPLRRHLFLSLGCPDGDAVDWCEDAASTSGPAMCTEGDTESQCCDTCGVLRDPDHPGLYLMVVGCYSVLRLTFLCLMHLKVCFGLLKYIFL